MSEIEFIPLETGKERAHGLTRGERFLRRRTASRKVDHSGEADLWVLVILGCCLFATVLHIIINQIYPTPVKPLTQAEACALVLAGEAQVVEEWLGQTDYECDRLGV